MVFVDLLALAALSTPARAQQNTAPAPDPCPDDVTWSVVFHRQPDGSVLEDCETADGKPGTTARIEVTRSSYVEQPTVSGVVCAHVETVFSAYEECVELPSPLDPDGESPFPSCPL